MDERQLVCYPGSRPGSVWCALLSFFSILNVLSKSPSHHQLRCCPSTCYFNTPVLLMENLWFWITLIV